ncbi:FAD synthase-like [Copidosoma floridanum]|uniref:FAD synthase-like n=1 Tax=Copidosoma floridanum TaxID=29053 RepID=UPI0006C9D98E|nr:FAD synthase-like [Copidosoma floridanum]
MTVMSFCFWKTFFTSADVSLRLFQRYSSTCKKKTTAGVIVIGNEILKAQVKETNSHFICKRLYRCGVKVEKISVVPDNVDVIAQEIKEFSEKYTHVITSGGIGPTHDDVTYEGLAKAFGDTLHCHPTLAEIIRSYFGAKDLSSPTYKLAHIPKRAVLKFGVHKDTCLPLNFPCVILKNVYVFPGSPVYLQIGFESLYRILFDSNNRFVHLELYLNAYEETFANALTKVAEEFPNVIFGSYPENASDYKARVTIESDSESETRRAKEKFCSLIPPDIIINQKK